MITIYFIHMSNINMKDYIINNVITTSIGSSSKPLLWLSTTAWFDIVELGEQD